MCLPIAWELSVCAPFMCSLDAAVGTVLLLLLHLPLLLLLAVARRAGIGRAQQRIGLHVQLQAASYLQVLVSFH